jgi:hypothetical protein
VAGSSGHIANTLNGEGQPVETEKLHRKALEIRRRFLVPKHPQTLQLMTNLVRVLKNMNRYAEAEQLAKQGLEIQRRTLGSQNPDRT